MTLFQAVEERYLNSLLPDLFYNYLLIGLG